jgi:glycosyltransferase involved in cell wall biosynthesis
VLSKRVLLVAYPLLPVSEASAGGAEQILFTLARGLGARGWETVVAACAGSVVSGELLVTGAAPGGVDGFEEREREHAERVVEACASHEFDMVLDHSGHFYRHAGRVRECVLATLHLPRALYGEQAFEGVAENVYFHCVSESQRGEFMDLPRVLGVVKNGITVERFALGGRKSDYVLWLGRVCPEKAPHLAIEAARRAGLRIKVAGQVYPFRWHEAYWEQKVKPLVDGDWVEWIPLPSFVEKTRLLREARALLVTSQVNETTSLVALEAMASGTPVIAFGCGALTEVVAKGTGFIVSSVEEMAAACGAASEIRPLDCRQWVAREYSARAMTDGYEALMAGLAEREERRRGAGQ